MLMTENTPTIDGANIGHWRERVDLAAALRWTARLNIHEAVVNHFSLATVDRIVSIASAGRFPCVLKRETYAKLHGSMTFL
jgi:hypothetical protein